MQPTSKDMYNTLAHTSILTYTHSRVAIVQPDPSSRRCVMSAQYMHVICLAGTTLAVNPF